MNEETNLKENQNTHDDTPLKQICNSAFNKFNNSSDKVKKRTVIISLIIAYLLGIGSHMLVGVKRSAYNSLLSDKNNVTNQLKETNTKYENTQKEFDDYKAKMQPYESIQLEDAKNKTEKESRELAEKKAAEEKAAAEAKAKKEAEEKAAAEKKAAEERAAAEAKAAEEAKGYETGITFDNLARTPDEYKGKKVKFSGKVVQVIEGTSETQLRLAVNGNYDKIIFCRVPKAKTSSTRILEDDYIHIMGVSNGLISYESTMGGNITIPDVSVDDWGQG